MGTINICSTIVVTTSNCKSCYNFRIEVVAAFFVVFLLFFVRFVWL